MNNKISLDKEELALLDEIENNQWIDAPLSPADKEKYKEYATYTKSLQEKRQTTIRFSVKDLAAIKAKSKDLGIGYQNLIQALVHNYAIGKIKIEL